MTAVLSFMSSGDAACGHLGLLNVTVPERALKASRGDVTRPVGDQRGLAAAEDYRHTLS